MRSFTVLTAVGVLFFAVAALPQSFLRRDSTEIVELRSDDGNTTTEQLLASESHEWFNDTASNDTDASVLPEPTPMPERITIGQRFRRDVNESGDDSGLSSNGTNNATDSETFSATEMRDFDLHEHFEESRRVRRAVANSSEDLSGGVANMTDAQSAGADNGLINEMRDFDLHEHNERRFSRAANDSEDGLGHGDFDIKGGLANETESAQQPSASMSEEAHNCTNQAVCFDDKECGGGKGKCLGVFVGKCNCNACINFLTCTDDAACGGLKHACDTEQSRCNCIDGLKKNGFAQFVDALRDLCNVKECGRDADTCFGLPCNAGRCFCEHQQEEPQMSE